MEIFLKTFNLFSGLFEKQINRTKMMIGDRFSYKSSLSNASDLSSVRIEFKFNINFTRSNKDGFLSEATS